MVVALISRLLNVGKKEFPRITIAWTLHLLLRTGFVMGWTVTVAMFINRVGIESLPYLLVLNALLVMLGSLIYSNLLKQINKPILILFTTLSAGAVLCVSTFFVYSQPLLFFGFILLAQSMLLSQLNILISLFTEDLFSPLESQRSFPLIASAETIGGILGGFAIFSLGDVMPSYKFIYLWIVLITLVIPTLLISQAHAKKIPSIEIHKNAHRQKRANMNLLKSLQFGFKKIRKVPFLRGMAMIVMMQFMLVNLLEFQYTKAIQETVTDRANALYFEVHNYEPGTQLKVSLLQVAPIDKEQRALHLEQELTHDLGTLQMIFSSGSLLVQILLASRVITGLGIVGSLAINPLVTLLHLVAMAFNFNFLTAATTRSSFEITSGIFKNAYHSSYYALGEKLREQMKEFLEGFIKPIGAVMAFILLFLIQTLWSNKDSTLVITLVMMMTTAAMLLGIVKLKRSYTHLSIQNLEPVNDFPARLMAVEVLGQKGHKKSTEQLLHYLQKKNEPPKLKLKILETLQGRQDPMIAQTLLECLELGEEKPEVRLAILETLLHMDQLKVHLAKKAFTRYRTIERIKALFQNDESEAVRGVCIQLLAQMDDGEVIEFILQVMHKGEPDIQKACIKACSGFHDINILPFVQEYLRSKNPHLRAQTVAALWQFPSLRNMLKHYREKLKKSREKENIIATLELLGEIGEKKDLPYLIKHLASTQPTIREAACRALGQMNHPAAIPHLVEFIVHENSMLVEKTKQFVSRLEGSIASNIEHLVHLRISEYIQDLLNKTKANTLIELDIETLHKLKRAYDTVEEHAEVDKIEKIIKQKLLMQNAYALSQ